MRAGRRTTQFKKDVKRAKKRKKAIEKLKVVIEKLARGEPLEARHHDHALTGPYGGARDCHIEPDWILIYEASEDELVLIRTGTHADLFS